jgi:hypothetical protein
MTSAACAVVTTRAARVCSDAVLFATKVSCVVSVLSWFVSRPFYRVGVMHCHDDNCCAEFCDFFFGVYGCVVGLIPWLVYSRQHGL